MYRNLFLSSISIINRCTVFASTSTAKAISSKTQSIIDRETQYGAANYHPLPVVIQRGLGMCLK
jgi:hypothetical protein